MGKRSRDPETRRILMQAWCRIRCGDDTWSDGWGGICSGVVLILLAMFLLNWLTGNAAYGDLIIEVDYLDATVYHESYALVDEVGLGLTGKGRPLGWLAFYQPETLWGDGPGVEFGGWTARYGGVTEQSLQFYTDANGYLRTALYGDRITGDVGALVSGGYLRADTQIPIGHAAVYLPFVWSSHADQYDGDEVDTIYSGTGWISFTAFNQAPPAGTPASFTVGEVLLTTADSYAGQTVFSQAVPEPATWGLFALVCCALVAWKKG